jgi:hypothetical protein
LLALFVGTLEVLVVFVFDELLQAANARQKTNVTEIFFNTLCCLLFGR